MAESWEKRATETNKAFGAFCYYLELGSKRTLRACSEGGKYSTTGVRKWSARHDWESRASAYDVAALQRSIDSREQVRERARQVLMNGLEDAATTLGEVRSGKLSMPECGPDCTEDACVCGVWVQILDRHGEPAGRRPAVAPSTRQAAAQAELDRCGLMPPKRVEITGKDGERLRLEARLEMGKLTGDKLDTILDIFAPDKEE